MNIARLQIPNHQETFVKVTEMKECLNLKKNILLGSIKWHLKKI